MMTKKQLFPQILVMLIMGLIVGCSAIERNEFVTAESDSAATDLNIEHIAILVKQGDLEAEIGFDGHILLDEGGVVESWQADPERLSILLDRLDHRAGQTVEAIEKDYRIDSSNVTDMAEWLNRDEIIYLSIPEGNRYVIDLRDAESHIYNPIRIILYEIDAYIRETRPRP